MALLHTHFFSEVLGMESSCEVLLPQKAAPEHGFRCLWLLHGMSDDETMWQRRTSIERYADAHEIAVIMPAVQLSCYADMAHGLPFYTYTAKELPDLMRGFFPLSSRREDNYIAGLSMGGEGACKIGLSNPEQYAAIGCLSAGMFNHPYRENLTPEDGWTFVRYDGKPLAGSPQDCFANARKILAEGKPVPRFFHAIGHDDFLLKAAAETREFFTSLPGNPFDYTYVEAPGSHTWQFWDTHIQEFLDFIDR